MFQIRQAERATVALLIVFGFASLLGCNRAQVRTDTGHERATANKTESASWSFDNISVGELPAGWKVDATNTKGDLATWRVVKDTTSPSGDHVLALTTSGYTQGQTYNICWTDAVSFLDGEIEVRFKSVTGEVDQGGGVVWRVQDVANYYIARFNPLENNFRVYKVDDGKRSQLASADVEAPAGEWHTIRITHKGSQIRCYLNGKLHLDVKDETFSKIGPVGLWTKADAVTSFDDFAYQEI